MATTDLIIIGAGGFGREVAAMIRYSALAKDYNLLGFVDDTVQKGRKINGIEVLGDVSWLADRAVKPALVLAIGSPKTRKNIAGKLPGFNCPNIIHPAVKLHDPDNINTGKGNIICDGNIFTTNITIGNFNIINLSCTIGHDTNVGNYCSIMPGVSISGGTRIMDQVYVGTGAKLIKMTTLDTGCVIGAGSVVNTDIPSFSTYAGIPAKLIKT